MPVLPLVYFPDDILRNKSTPVTEFNPELTKLASDMTATMYFFQGIGLAAPQIGVNKRIIVIDLQGSSLANLEEHPEDCDCGCQDEIDEANNTDEEVEEDAVDDNDADYETEETVSDLHVLINPVITASEGEVSIEEGCLSIPGFNGKVPRKAKISLSYQDLAGEQQSLEADGLFAICIQHEIDHLDGKLFVDSLSYIQQQNISKKMLKHKEDIIEDANQQIQVYNNKVAALKSTQTQNNDE